MTFRIGEYFMSGIGANILVIYCQTMERFEGQISLEVNFRYLWVISMNKQLSAISYKQEALFFATAYKNFKNHSTSTSSPLILHFWTRFLEDRLRRVTSVFLNLCIAKHQCRVKFPCRRSKFKNCFYFSAVCSKDFLH